MTVRRAAADDRGGDRLSLPMHLMDGLPAVVSIPFTGRFTDEDDVGRIAGCTDEFEVGRSDAIVNDANEAARLVQLGAKDIGAVLALEQIEIPSVQGSLQASDRIFRQRRSA